MRKRIFEIIEVGTKQDKASRVYDVFMMITIIISIIPLWSHNTLPVYKIINQVTVSIFILDYALRLATADFKLNRGALSFLLYPFSFMAIIEKIIVNKIK